ncbi:transglycosylase SLT domain-containing protein [Paenibacillus sp. HJL G12]|uniref:Transglycosylase SLT domain-containing protein n=1 Tax=Paenibacillus dendrobii TaxID=2691084 RepID=A0A7X3IGL6_9BACL|nr:transglycosylase SLT domain-containing protein [Paenibacillus dendrobii]MWV43061.1 transglycosylase SLT domain-containing protein [Paenibacillus dendrobii]
MIKHIFILAIAAMMLVACTPQERVLVNRQPQSTITENVLEEQGLQVLKRKANDEANRILIVSLATHKKQQHPEIISKPAQAKKDISVEKKLVRHMISKHVPQKNAERFASEIMKYCNMYKIDPYTILAMIEVETGATYNPNLVGRNHEEGLLQILPSTQKFMNMKGNLFNTSVNIEIGVKYLAYCQKKFGIELGIIAYNQGEGNVKRGTYNTNYLAKVNKVLSKINR